MTYRISHSGREIKGEINVPGSKSESNRLLILKALYFPDLCLNGLSSSNDTQTMLSLLATEGKEQNVGDAGTVMRFLTAFYAVGDKEVVLEGTKRMHERPIGLLVEALRKLGADIEYLGKEAYPPLRIKGKKLTGGTIEFDSSISSQFISALMMIAPSIKGGLSIQLKGNLVSKPYIKLTADLMSQLGFNLKIKENEIIVQEGFSQISTNWTIEPDWSSASYWYLIAALSKSSSIQLNSYRKDSLQGDSNIVQLFDSLGVNSVFSDKGVQLNNEAVSAKGVYAVNMLENPDLAQTLAVGLAALKIKARLTGLQTLKIKETDRLLALKTELEKTGAKINIGDDFLEIEKGVETVEGIKFNTWEDHRMAMSLAPLALLGEILIEDPEVVKKSYPSFWKDLDQNGFKVIL